MSQKEEFILALKGMEFERINNLLDDEKSYMNVSKSLFLNRLQKSIKKSVGFKNFTAVVTGQCNMCNKGSLAYQFIGNNKATLNLFIQEIDGTIMDIYLCNSIQTTLEPSGISAISFSFFDDEEVDFVPSLSHLILLQKIDRTIDEFNKLAELVLIPFEELEYWYQKNEYLISVLHLNNPFKRPNFKSFEKIIEIFKPIHFLVKNSQDNRKAELALQEYSAFKKDDERSMITWLLKYRNLHFFTFEKPPKWAKTGFLFLDKNKKLLVDYSEHIACFKFEDLYSNLHSKIVYKYAPTDEQLKKIKKGIVFSLISHLRFQKVYLDLLNIYAANEEY